MTDRPAPKPRTLAELLAAIRERAKDAPPPVPRNDAPPPPPSHHEPKESAE